jgi:hypothetical protein
MGYFGQIVDCDPEIQQPFELTISGGQDGGIQTFPEIGNSGQAMAPRQLNARRNSQAMDHDQDTPDPTHAPLPPTATPGSTQK